MSMGNNPAFGWTYTVNAAPAIQQINATQQAAQQLHAVVAQGPQVFQNYGGSAVQAARNIDVLGTSSMASSQHVQALLGHMAQFVSTAAALGLISKAFTEMGAAIKEAREHGEQTGKTALTQRDKARELANLMGETDPNDRVMARIFNTSLASGMKFDESIKYLEQFYGSVPAAIKKGNVREEQLPELAAMGARAAVRLGLDPGTGGDLAGVIGQHINLNNQKDAQGRTMTARDALAAQIEAMAFGANEGRGQVSVLMRGELAQAASSLASGRVGSLAEMGSFVGTASTLSKTGAFAGTLFSQLDSALNRQDKFGDFLKKIGVADQHGDRAKLGALKDHVDQVKPADVNAYLAKNGLKSQQERKALVGFMENLEVLDKTTAEAEKRAHDPAAALRKQAAFEASLDFQNRKADARVQAAEFETGDRNAPLLVARKNALARLEHMGLLHDENQVEAEKLKHLFNNDSWTGAPDALKRQIDDEVADDIERRIPDARQRGLTKNFRSGLAIHHGLGATNTEAVENFNRAMAENPAVLGGDNDGGIGVTFRGADRHDAQGRPIPGGKPWQANPAAVGQPAGPQVRPGVDVGKFGPQAAADAAKMNQAADKLGHAADKLLAAVNAPPRPAPRAPVGRHPAPDLGFPAIPERPA